jgi:hypothetical protein
MCPIGAAGLLESQFAKRVDCLVESSLSLPQHAAEHRPKRPILLAIDQQLTEGAELSGPSSGLRVRSLVGGSKR